MAIVAEKEASTAVAQEAKQRHEQAVSELQVHH